MRRQFQRLVASRTGDTNKPDAATTRGNDLGERLQFALVVHQLRVGPQHVVDDMNDFLRRRKLRTDFEVAGIDFKQARLVEVAVAARKDQKRVVIKVFE
jgi:hypothetical protein